MAKKFNVEVTNQGAVYVNNTRVTGRETKWGNHLTIFKVSTTRTNVSKVLEEHGYGHIRLDREYLTEMGLS